MGESVCIESQTIKMATSLHESINSAFLFPLKKNPYIHFERKGEIGTQVLQKKKRMRCQK